MCVMASGQFSRKPEVRVYDIHQGVDPLKKEAVMEVKGNRLHVTRWGGLLRSSWLVKHWYIKPCVCVCVSGDGRRTTGWIIRAA